MNILMLDLETTGLDPRVDVIIEIAISTPAHDTTYTTLIKPIRPINVVYDQELYMEAMAKGQELSEVDAIVASCIPEKTILCGNSIHFDRSFIKVYMPLLEAKLQYRMLDVTAVGLFLESYGHKVNVPKKKTHRAGDDLDETTNEIIAYGEYLKL